MSRLMRWLYRYPLWQQGCLWRHWRHSPSPAVITGVVRSEFGEPLENANVYIVELAYPWERTRGALYLTIPADRVRGQVVQLPHAPMAEGRCEAADGQHRKPDVRLVVAEGHQPSAGSRDHGRDRGHRAEARVHGGAGERQRTCPCPAPTAPQLQDGGRREHRVGLRSSRGGAGCHSAWSPVDQRDQPRPGPARTSSTAWSRRVACRTSTRRTSRTSKS